MYPKNAYRKRILLSNIVPEKKITPKYCTRKEFGSQKLLPTKYFNKITWIQQGHLWEYSTVNPCYFGNSFYNQKRQINTILFGYQYLRVIFFSGTHFWDTLFFSGTHFGIHFSFPVRIFGIHFSFPVLIFESKILFRYAFFRYTLSLEIFEKMHFLFLMDFLEQKTYAIMISGHDCLTY